MDESARPQSHIEIEVQLRRMNDEWVKALVRCDGEALDRLMADDFVFTYPLEGDDKVQFINDVVSGDLKVIQMTRENVGVRIWGHTAVISSLDSAQWFYQGRDFTGRYKAVHIYADRDNRWQLVAVQACPIG